jgi:hypothetical protein
MRRGQVPPPLDANLVLQQLPPPSIVTGANWPEERAQPKPTTKQHSIALKQNSRTEIISPPEQTG